LKKTLPLLTLTTTVNGHMLLVTSDDNATHGELAIGGFSPVTISRVKDSNINDTISDEKRASRDPQLSVDYQPRKIVRGKHQHAMTDESSIELSKRSIKI